MGMPLVWSLWECVMSTWHTSDGVTPTAARNSCMSPGREVVSTTTQPSEVIIYPELPPLGLDKGGHTRGNFMDFHNDYSLMATLPNSTRLFGSGQ